MSTRPCDPAIIGGLAVLQSAFPAMAMPEGVVSLVEAGLRRLPGVGSARLHLRMEPMEGTSDDRASSANHVWVQTASGRFGWLELSLADEDAYEPYDPYVRNLMNSIAIHVENAHQRAQLERALAAVREADRRKDEFLGVLSHELRNPLAPIRNCIYLLRHAGPGSELASRAQEIIQRQTEHLTRLVDDLLDVKRVSTGKFRIRTTRMDLTRQVRETAEDLRPVFADRSRTLTLELPSEPVWIEGDATRIAQVVGNLLHNASKFTDPGGRVTIAVESSGGEARVRVRDDGVGVPAELLPTLFEPFVQSESTLDRSRGGLGLGLALVRGIVELHSGRVAARSEGSGKGTEVIVTLPTAGAPAASREAAPPAPHASKRRVLIIDDDRDAAESLRELLQVEGGHEVVVASDGQGGIEAARETAPDVILCDLGLPVIDGYEIARRLRSATGPVRHCRLIALSGYAGPEDVARSLRAGFAYHVAKPPNVPLLLTLVAEAPRARGAATVPEALATGHAEVDAQHAAIIREATCLRDGAPEAAWDAVHFLQLHASSHFAYEDRLMEDVDYPDAAGHREQHAAFVTEVRRLRERLEREGPTRANVDALADAVSSWVADHVLDEDRRLAEFIRSQAAAPAGAPGATEA